MSPHLGIKSDQNISPIPIQAHDPHSKIWLIPLKLGSIGALICSWRDQTGLQMTIYLWFSTIRPRDAEDTGEVGLIRVRCGCYVP